MKMLLRRRSALIPLLITILVMALAMAFGAAASFADSGGMSGMSEEEMQSMPGMSGMSAEEMQNMATPAPGPDVAGDSMPAPADAHAGDVGPGMDPHMDMGGGSANWFVVGGFIVMVAGATLAAAATKCHLRRRMLAGELGHAGVRGV